MKEYIKFFKYDADYQLAKPNLPEPHAVYCWESNITDISKPVWNEKQYLAFKPVDGAAALSITNNGGATPQLWYSYDQIEWTDWTASGYKKIEIMDGQKVYLKGLNDQIGYSSSKYSTFSGTGKYEVSGSITSILDGDDIYGNLDRVYKDHMFYKLFSNNTCLVKFTAELPATTLSNYCYGNMFEGCSSLVTAPALPATNLARSCYEYMFNECSSLVTTPALPATTLASYCYDHMFNGCSSLVNAPELPATTLSDRAYTRMFEGCSSLVTAPELPATNLAPYCYSGMFYNCTSLVTAPVLPATTLVQGCYEYMFAFAKNVNYIEIYAYEANSSCTNMMTGYLSTPGTFRCYSTAGWTTGNNGIPNGWTVEYIDK